MLEEKGTKTLLLFSGLIVLVLMAISFCVGCYVGAKQQEKKQCVIRIVE